MGMVNIWSILMYSAALRLFLIVYGEWQDSNMEVRYTDVDYLVFSDAASLVFDGKSPYKRTSYRYSPLINYLLVPNAIIHRSWGKFLFSTSDNRWSEVASSMNPECKSSFTSQQLQKIYEIILCSYEQIYHYRTSAQVPLHIHQYQTSGEVPPEVDSTPGSTSNSGNCPSCLSRKRKLCKKSKSPVSIICYDVEQVAGAKKICNVTNFNEPSKGHGSVKETIGEITVEDKSLFESKAPVKPRSAYQLFAKKEYERLKETNRESSEKGTSRAMVTKAWRELPEEKRKFFVEESKKDKERYNQEMESYNDVKKIPVPKPRNRPSYKEATKKPKVTPTKMMWPITDGDYHITVEPAPENLRLPNESDIVLAMQLMENQPVSDTVFRINLEEYWTIDFPA